MKYVPEEVVLFRFCWNTTLLQSAALLEVTYCMQSQTCAEYFIVTTTERG